MSDPSTCPICSAPQSGSPYCPEHNPDGDKSEGRTVKRAVVPVGFTVCEDCGNWPEYCRC